MPAWTTLDGAPPRIIAHRGASGLRPEHTLAAYQLAIEQGADLIEPDLVPSRDGVLFARHERNLSHSTDIAGRAEFSHRAEKPGGGARHWRIDQLLGSEVDQLRARQAFAGRDLSFDGQFAIPRFEQVVALARKQWLSGRQLGVYPEIKHPDELRREGIDATGLLINALRRLHVAGHDSPVWVQCFERWPLDQVRQDCGNKVFALFEASHRTRGNWLQRLHQESPWLDGIALPKSMLIGPHRQVGLSAAAHELGWQVHVYTLRDDSVATGFASVEEEFSALFAEGVDALFCDFPATGLAARAAFGAA